MDIRVTHQLSHISVAKNIIHFLSSDGLNDFSLGDKQVLYFGGSRHENEKLWD